LDPREPIRKAVSAFYAAHRERDPGAVVALFAAESIAHIPVGAPELDTPESRKEYWEGLLGLFSDLHMTEDSVFYSGHGAAVKWSAEGVGTEGRTVSFEGIDAFQFDPEGAIQVMMSWWDPGEMMLDLKG
jgi:hypothetical protein